MHRSVLALATAASVFAVTAAAAGSFRVFGPEAITTGTGSTCNLTEGNIFISTDYFQGGETVEQSFGGTTLTATMQAGVVSGVSVSSYIAPPPGSQPGTIVSPACDGWRVYVKLVDDVDQVYLIDAPANSVDQSGISATLLGNTLYGHPAGTGAAWRTGSWLIDTAEGFYVLQPHVGWASTTVWVQPEVAPVPDPH